MIKSTLFFVALASSVSVQAQQQFYWDNACQAKINPNDGTDNGAFFDYQCGSDCVATGDRHSFLLPSAPPDTQVLVYQSTDCTGDVYAAAGNAYGSSVGVGNCAPSTNDPIRSFQIVVYDNPDGGSACPPGTLTAAPSKYPEPTG